MVMIGKAVIFDLDGVIVNSQELYEASLSEFLGGLGVDEVDWKTLVGMTTARALSCLKERRGLPGTVAGLTEQFQRVYLQAFKRSLRDEHLVEGVKPFIERLADARVRMAVASSATRPKIDFALSRFGLSRYFACTVSSYEVKMSKPAPDVFIQAARRLNVPPGDCIVIEDAANGILGAKTAGMHCIGYRNAESGDQDLSGADLVIERFASTEDFVVRDGRVELRQSRI